MRFASLFTETAYSFSGSNITIEVLFDMAKKNHQSTVVLTDTKMHAAYKFIVGAKKHDLSPVIGLQLRFEGLFESGVLHGVAYAQNGKGYKNLLKLASLQSFNAILPFSLAKPYADNLTFVLMPHAGDVFQAKDDCARLKSIIHEVKQTFHDVMFGKHEAYPFVDHGISTVPIDYVLIQHEEDRDVFETLSAIFEHQRQWLKNTIDIAIKHPSYFHKLSDEDQKALNQFIANHTIDVSFHEASLPSYQDTHGLKTRDYLVALAKKGLEKRLKGKSVDAKKYRERLAYELNTIHELGYEDYFLIVYDCLRFARSAEMLVGPGRGSAPGSLVAYALGITHVDPIAFGLLFERFLNKARKTMPDIDIDFPDHARPKMIEYVVKRYGKPYVSQICTFGTFLRKSALRESARHFNVSPSVLEEVMRKIADYDSVEAMISENLDVQNRMAQHEDVNTWLHVAKRLEGLPKHVSTHAAGIILSDRDITEYTAIQPGLHDHHQTQFEQHDLEALGLLKIDFLGLKNLTMIEEVLDLIEQNQGNRLDMFKVPLQDKKTFALLREQSTTGIFQLESQGMRALVKDMQIREFDDIVTILALFRPGPMQSIDDYLKRRHKKQRITPLDPSIQSILEPTEGILLYQEQIMAIASTFAHYSLEEADLLRRAVSKKDAATLEKERDRFVKKAIHANRDEARANKIYDYIVTFADYGFNKSHSVAYALVAYWMAYLKAHYPAYFIAVLMQNALHNENLIKTYVREAAASNIRVEGPNVNISTTRFVLKDKTLVYPLSGIKNLGSNLAKGLVQARGKQVFTSFVDFVARTRSVLNKRAYESLIKAGACDCFKINRKTLIDDLPGVQHYIDYHGRQDDFVHNVQDEFDETMLLQYEKDVIGIALSYDPLKPYESYIKKARMVTPSTIDKTMLERYVTVAASLGRHKAITTKKGDAMAFFTLEDRISTLDAVVFPRAYQGIQNAIEEGTVYQFKGRLTEKNGQLQMVLETVAPFV